MMPNIRAHERFTLQREMRVPSVGPFEVTEVEFVGLEFMRQEDERQLRKTTLRATWSGRELNVKAGEQRTRTSNFKSDIDSRVLAY
jgi:hypothetical protein